ncbi:MAG: hypothetical protein M3M87_05405 [Thermoproteota archaeon]|nr:hypothetical protein [Thermoproteota archaeon]
MIFLDSQKKTTTLASTELGKQIRKPPPITRIHIEGISAGSTTAIPTSQ